MTDPLSIPRAVSDEDTTPKEDTIPDPASPLIEQIRLIQTPCFDENLADYTANHPEITISAGDLKKAVRSLINGETIQPEVLTILRQHASQFYEFVKANSARTIQAKRGEGLREASRRVNDAIRAVMGKIDPIMGLGAKLSELVPNFNLMEKVEIRIAQMEKFAANLGLAEDEISAMKHEMMELVRAACLPYTEVGSYKKLKQLGQMMQVRSATAIGIDFSEILGKYFGQKTDTNEFMELLKSDNLGKNNVEKTITEKDTSSQPFRDLVLLAAMRKTVANSAAMRPVQMPEFGEESGFETMFRGKIPPPAKVFFYNPQQGSKQEKTSTTSTFPSRGENMETLSQWLTIILARLMNNAEKMEKSKGMTLNGLDPKPLYDNMDPKAGWETWKSSMPDFDDRNIVRL